MRERCERGCGFRVCSLWCRDLFDTDVYRRKHAVICKMLVDTEVDPVSHKFKRVAAAPSGDVVGRLLEAFEKRDSERFEMLAARVRAQQFLSISPLKSLANDANVSAGAWLKVAVGLRHVRQHEMARTIFRALQQFSQRAAVRPSVSALVLIESADNEFAADQHAEALVLLDECTTRFGDAHNAAATRDSPNAESAGLSRLILAVRVHCALRDDARAERAHDSLVACFGAGVSEPMSLCCRLEYFHAALELKCLRSATLMADGSLTDAHVNAVYRSVLDDASRLQLLDYDELRATLLTWKPEVLARIWDRSLSKGRFLLSVRFAFETAYAIAYAFARLAVEHAPLAHASAATFLADARAFCNATFSPDSVPSAHLCYVEGEFRERRGEWASAVERYGFCQGLCLHLFNVLPPLGHRVVAPLARCMAKRDAPALPIR